MKITNLKSGGVTLKKLIQAASNSKLFPIDIKVQGIPKLEIGQM